MHAFVYRTIRNIYVRIYAIIRICVFHRRSGLNSTGEIGGQLLYMYRTCVHMHNLDYMRLLYCSRTAHGRCTVQYT